MAIAHTLTDMDTLQSLALQYLNDIARWTDISDYNNLEYPYIITDSTEISKLYASGYITVVRASTTNAVIIKKGWTFTTKLNIFIGSVIKTFVVSEDTVIPAGVATYQIPLQSVVPGTFGNVMEYMITEAGADTLSHAEVNFLSIYNTKCFNGGQDLHVLTVGNTIYIPLDSSELGSNNSITNELSFTYGEDIVLDTEGNVVFENGGDIAAVAGVDNVQHAIKDRLVTELGSVLAHPEYGTELIDLIGMPNLASRERLAQIAVQRSLSQEDRITDVVINSFTMTNTSAYVDVSYRLVVSNVIQNVSTSITGGVNNDI